MIENQAMLAAVRARMNFLRDRLVSPDGEHKQIARAMITVSIFIILAALPRVAKEVAVASHYGISAKVDAYLFVFNLVNWPVGIGFSLLTSVLVPLAALIKQRTPGGLALFRSELLGLIMIVGLALTVAALLGLPWLVRSSIAGLAPKTAHIAISIIPLLAWLGFFGMVVNLWSAWMLSASRHTNSLLEGVPALTIFVTLWLSGSSNIKALVWATLAGFILHAFCLAVPLARSGDIEVPRLRVTSSEWPIFWRGFSVMAIGQVLQSLGALADQFFAAHLNVGAIATLGYANRILSLILTLGATAVTRASLPIFSRMQTEGSLQIRRTSNIWAIILFVAGIGATIISWLLAPWIVTVIFERGAFTTHDVGAVTKVLRFGLTQLPVYVPGIVLVSALLARRKYVVLTIISSFNLLVKLFFNWLLVPYFGIGGVMLATSLMYASSTIAALLAVHKDW